MAHVIFFGKSHILDRKNIDTSLISYLMSAGLLNHFDIVDEKNWEKYKAKKLPLY